MIGIVLVLKAGVTEWRSGGVLKCPADIFRSFGALIAFPA
jgi:hypothetical protein